MNPLYYIQRHPRWAFFGIANVICGILFSVLSHETLLKTKWSRSSANASPLRSSLPRIATERESSSLTSTNAVMSNSSPLVPAAGQSMQIALDTILGHLRIQPIDESGNFNVEFSRLLGMSERDIEYVTHQVSDLIAQKQRSAEILSLDANNCVIPKADFETIRKSLKDSATSCAIPESHRTILTEAVLQSTFFTQYLFSDIHTRLTTNSDASVALTVEYSRIVDDKLSTQYMTVNSQSNLSANPNILRFQTNTGGRLVFGPTSFSVK